MGGALSTSKVKSIRQTEFAVVGGVRTTGPDGVNGHLAGRRIDDGDGEGLAGAGGAGLADAGRAELEYAGVGLGDRAVAGADEGGGAAGGDQVDGVDGDIAGVLGRGGGVEDLEEAGRPVWPTVTIDGKVGVTPKPTPAKADGMLTAKGTKATTSAMKPRRARRPPPRDRNRNGSALRRPDPVPALERSRCWRCRGWCRLCRFPGFSCERDPIVTGSPRRGGPGGLRPGRPGSCGWTAS